MSDFCRIKQIISGHTKAIFFSGEGAHHVWKADWRAWPNLIGQAGNTVAHFSGFKQQP